MKPCILLLTCSDQKEADLVAKKLLEKRLAACVKFVPTNSTYRWKGKIESASEILLIIESIVGNFEEIQAVLEKIHSYETFNLTMVSVEKTTEKVQKWLENEINQA